MSHRMLPLLVAIVAGSCLLASPVHAAEEIGLSNDGVTWSSTLERPLFDPAFRWVPGDSETASFYVRNQGPSSALLAIAARSADTDELLEHDDIRLRARAAGGDWVAIENGVASRSLTSQSLRRGASTQVQVNATFDPASTNQSQTKVLRLDFVVTLADHRALEPPDAADGSADESSSIPTGVGAALPSTGSPLGILGLMIGALLVLLGGHLARRRGDDGDV